MLFIATTSSIVRQFVTVYLCRDGFCRSGWARADVYDAQAIVQVITKIARFFAFFSLVCRAFTGGIRGSIIEEANVQLARLFNWMVEIIAACTFFSAVDGTRSITIRDSMFTETLIENALVEVFKMVEIVACGALHSTVN